MLIEPDDTFFDQIRCAESTSPAEIQLLSVFLGLRDPQSIKEQELYYGSARLLMSTSYDAGVAANRRFVA
jgi:hypothetical protein